MSTLLLRLAAPIQSWGVDAKFNRRGTERVPTKSGVIGLVAAALGRRRNESIGDLLTLNYGVRVDREGISLRDYHTAINPKTAYVTQRYYLQDAVFLAGLEGDGELLAKIEHALHVPAFPLFLGRRSCPPEIPILLGIRTDRNLLESLQKEPWQVSDWSKRRKTEQVQLRIIIDAANDNEYVYFQHDVPVSFNQIHRRYGFRRVCETEPVVVLNSNSRKASQMTKLSGHDPFIELEGG